MGLAELVDHLSALARNTMRMPLRTGHCFTLHSKPTPLRKRHSICLLSTLCLSSNEKAWLAKSPSRVKSLCGSQLKIQSKCSFACLLSGIYVGGPPAI
jgi:hypothetical protein